MKKLLIIALFPVMAHAQSNHLPKEITIKLTDKELIAFSTTIDSCRNLLIGSNYPSGAINSFVNRLQLVLSPIYKQVGQQMRVDTVKKPQPIKK